MQGQIFQETYRICGELGQGGMSTVFLAEHLRLDTKWAIKKVSKHAVANFDVRVEANLLKRLSHPMLPRITDIFDDADYIYIIEDFIPGVSMDKYLMIHGPVPEAQALEWFKAVCGALNYLHTQKRPIIYRDMKPSNIIVQPDGSLKLIDFGIAREYKDGSSSDTACIGTKGYAAPEQFGTFQTDARTDIYSLGVTIYHIVTGKSPYEPPYKFLPVRQLNPKLSAGIEYILGKCLQPEPNDRYQSIELLYSDLVGVYRFEHAYKVHKAKNAIKASALVAMFACSLFMIYRGYLSIGTEKTGRYNELISQAESIAANDLPSAESLLEQAQELYPQTLSAYEREAYLLYLYDDAGSCIEYITNELFTTLPKAKESGELNAILASEYFNNGDYTSAANYFKLSAQNQDLNTERIRDYAVSVGRTGDIDGAREILSRLTKKGFSSETTYVSGELDWASGNFTLAEEEFLSVLSSTDDKGLKRRTYLSLAQLYKDSASTDSASGISDPLDKEIYIINTGINELSLQADAVFYEMLGQAYYNRGVEYSSKSDLIASADSFDRVLSLGISKDYIYTNIFTACQYAEEYDRAMDTLDKMKSAFPDNIIPYVYSSMLLIKEENDKPESMRDYSAAYDEYKLAARKLSPGSDAAQFQQLESLINQLIANGWIERN